MTRTITITLIALTLLALGACSPESRYERRVKRELASGKRYDDLFLGLHFGMDQKAFFDHCWKLNREKLIKEGPGNMSAEYIIKEIQPEVAMNFYPMEVGARMIKMRATFNYLGWTPWNRDLWADKLMPHVIELLEDWYGKGFIALKDPVKGHYFVKVDGNRHIDVRVITEQMVEVIFTDLSAVANQETGG